VDAALAARVARLAALVGRAPPLAVATDEARAITQEIAWERRYTGDGSVSRVEVDDLVELALRFVLDRPIAAALPSTIDPAHLARNLAVADGRRLSAELAAAVKQHAWPDAPPR
jgi:aryl-alcohol dehydrogenase-like predicted oxidoreductase